MRVSVSRITLVDGPPADVALPVRKLLRFRTTILDDAQEPAFEIDGWLYNGKKINAPSVRRGKGKINIVNVREDIVEQVKSLLDTAAKDLVAEVLASDVRPEPKKPDIAHLGVVEV